MTLTVHDTDPHLEKAMKTGTKSYQISTASTNTFIISVLLPCNSKIKLMSFISQKSLMRMHYYHGILW